MTAFIRSWLVMASVTLFSSWAWAQAPQFEGFAPGWGVQYNAGHQPPDTAPGPEYELLPENRTPWYDLDSQFELNLRDMVAESWVKVEYLQASFQKPGDSLLGAPLANVANPRDPFFVSAGDASGIQTVVPDTSRLDLDANNGVRTTIGMSAFRDFSVVVSYVGIQDMSSDFTLTPSTLDPTLFPNAVRFYATSVLDAGALGSRVILYDRLFEVDYAAKYWSGEVNLIYKSHGPRTGFRIQPIIGFRYNSYDEDLIQHGSFDNSSGVDATLGTFATPTRNTILSDTQNTLYMGQLGFQAELVDDWFTIGVAPKIAAGANIVRTHVLTSDLRDSTIAELANDGVTSIRQQNVIVGSNLDLNAYLKIKVNPWLSLTGSAYYWYMPNVARAHDTISYNDLGIDVAPAFRPQLKTNSMGIHGFTVGAEVTF